MSLLEFLGTIPDTRRKQGTRYQLKFILLFCVLSVLSGATGYATMALWMKLKQKELFTIFNLKWKKTPGKTCLSELFMSLNKKEMEKAFRAYSFDLANSKTTSKLSSESQNSSQNSLQIA